MAITIELPADVERELRAGSPDLDARARLALALDLYRSRKISVARLAQLLNDVGQDDDGLPEMSDYDDGSRFTFADADLDRCDELSEKAGEAMLAPDERRELDAMIRVDSVMTLLRLKAMRRAAIATSS